MKRSSLVTLAYISLGLALILCGAAGYLMWDISMNLATRQAANANAVSQNAQAQNAVHIEALAADSASDRATLNTLLQNDVLHIISTIQAAGKSAGTDTSIPSVTPGGLPQLPSNVTALEFIVQSQGSFAQVFNAAKLFETLPLPSQVEQLDFERQQNAIESKTWQLTAHIRVLTSAQIPS